MKLFFLISCLTSVLTLPITAEELKIFELRSYVAHEGKMKALHQRFNDHTLALFEKHGMTNLVYWVPQDNEGRASEDAVAARYGLSNTDAVEK